MASLCFLSRPCVTYIWWHIKKVEIQTLSKQSTGSFIEKWHKVKQFSKKVWWILKSVMVFRMLPNDLPKLFLYKWFLVDSKIILFLTVTGLRKSYISSREDCWGESTWSVRLLNTLKNWQLMHSQNDMWPVRLSWLSVYHNGWIATFQPINFLIE